MYRPGTFQPTPISALFQQFLRFSSLLLNFSIVIFKTKDDLAKLDCIQEAYDFQLLNIAPTAETPTSATCPSHFILSVHIQNCIVCFAPEKEVTGNHNDNGQITNRLKRIDKAG